MERQPRSPRARIALTLPLFIVLTVWAPLFASLDLGTIRLGHWDLWDVSETIAYPLALAILGYLATRVSERWYYALWMLVPFANIYVIWKISWRVAYLPWRDWELREDETSSPYDIVPGPIAKRREGMVQVRTD
jgi:hypothetical protein